MFIFVFFYAISTDKTIYHLLRSICSSHLSRALPNWSAKEHLVQQPVSTRCIQLFADLVIKRRRNFELLAYALVCIRLKSWCRAILCQTLSTSLSCVTSFVRQFCFCHILDTGNAILSHGSATAGPKPGWETTRLKDVATEGARCVSQTIRNVQFQKNRYVLSPESYLRRKLVGGGRAFGYATVTPTEVTTSPPGWRFCDPPM